MNNALFKKPVVVIGAGAGGLAAALSLTARNVPVIVLEKHAHVGGKMRQPIIAGKAFDAGPTVFTMRWVFEALFAQAGLKLSEHLSLQSADLLARHSWANSESLDLFADIDQSMAAIEAFANAKEADNYRQFALKSEKVFNTLNDTFMQTQRPNPLLMGVSGGLRGMIDMLNTQPFVSLWHSLSKSFHDPRLRQLFARYATYCGSSPFKAPATLMLIAHVERAGVWLVEGGMHALAKAISDVLNTREVEVRCNSGVASIQTHKGAVSSVTLDNGEVLETSAVVFNGDTQALATGLLGEPARHACSARQESSLSAITRCQYVRTAGFELAHHSVFFGDDYHDEFNSIFDQQHMTENPTVYICAQDRGVSADISPDQHERIFSLVNAPACSLSSDAIKIAVENMNRTLQSQGLQLHDEQGEGLVTSPNDFDAFFPASDGALYGRPTHGWLGSFKRPGAASALRGLYLCGGSVHPGAGVPMATLSGKLAAQRLCRDFDVPMSTAVYD